MYGQRDGRTNKRLFAIGSVFFLFSIDLNCHTTSFVVAVEIMLEWVGSLQCSWRNGYYCLLEGVRYNADKSKVGNYYSTPIWKFRMKCHLCDNYIEFQTDPKVSKQ